MTLFRNLVYAVLVFAIPLPGCSQQTDQDYVPEVETPIFKYGEGPTIGIDAAHHNFHTLKDKLFTLGTVARKMGFQVKEFDSLISPQRLSNVKILVIANALHLSNVDSWALPITSAYSRQEISLLKEWVWNGGRLFLIADHMPFAGASADLANAFGYTFYNGFALRSPKTKFDVFSFSNGMLLHNLIADMNGGIDSVVTFTGQAFGTPSNSQSVITLDTSYKILMPEVAWEFDQSTTILPAHGMSQLAYSNYGSGKIVVSGEAMMFTAQKAGDVRIGMNASYAKYNLSLLINIFEWLGK